MAFSTNFILFLRKFHCNQDRKIILLELTHISLSAKPCDGWWMAWKGGPIEIWTDNRASKVFKYIGGPTI